MLSLSFSLYLSLSLPLSHYLEQKPVCVTGIDRYEWLMKLCELLIHDPRPVQESTVMDGPQCLTLKFIKTPPVPLHANTLWQVDPPVR